MRIGIMGGTFDPIHNGHLTIAESAYEQYGLDVVRFMPNGNPPHKRRTSIGVDAAHRAEMVRLAIEGNPHFSLELYEAERKSISCSYETMEYFHGRSPEDDFFFIIGADSLLSIDTWVHPERLFPTCTVLAACRDELDTKHEMYELIGRVRAKYQARIGLVASPLVHVSSTELRSRCRRGASIRGLVPDPVAAYIQKEGLYES